MSGGYHLRHKLCSVRGCERRAFGSLGYDALPEGTELMYEKAISRSSKLILKSLSPKYIFWRYWWLQRQLFLECLSSFFASAVLLRLFFVWYATWGITNFCRSGGRMSGGYHLRHKLCSVRGCERRAFGSLGYDALPEGTEGSALALRRPLDRITVCEIVVTAEGEFSLWD